MMFDVIFEHFFGFASACFHMESHGSRIPTSQCRQASKASPPRSWETSPWRPVNKSGVASSIAIGSPVQTVGPGRGPLFSSGRRGRTVMAFGGTPDFHRCSPHCPLLPRMCWVRRHVDLFVELCDVECPSPIN